jgi:hypothetical protein
MQAIKLFNIFQSLFTWNAFAWQVLNFLKIRVLHPPTWRGRFGARWWPIGQATWPAGQVEWPPLNFSTDSGFSSWCRRMVTKAQAELPQTLADRPAPLPTRPGVWRTWSTCQIHLCGDDDFDIWSTSLCQPLKCSNLVPEFLKSNKH